MYDSSLGRLWGVLASPERTFRSVRERPSWVAPLVVLLLLALGLGFAAHARTDYREMTERTDEMMEDRGMPVPADELDERVEQRRRVTAIGTWVSPLFVAVVYLLVSGFFWVGFKIVGSDLTFVQSFATYLYGSMPLAVMMLLAIPVVVAGGTLSYEDLTTRNFLASNLAFLAPEGDLVVGSLLAGLDFFALWAAVLWVIGYRVVGRVSRGTAIAWVTVVFVLGLGLRMLGGWFGGGGA